MSDQLYREESYDGYLRSDIWKAKSKQAKARAGHRCEAVWNGMRCTNPADDTHHLHYRNAFFEPLEDLMAVCRDCHHRLHQLQKIVANDNAPPEGRQK